VPATAPRLGDFIPARAAGRPAGGEKEKQWVHTVSGATWEIPGKWQPPLLVYPVHGTDMYRINTLAQWFFIPVRPKIRLHPEAITG
jgi:hypothetical protein